MGPTGSWSVAKRSDGGVAAEVFAQGLDVGPQALEILALCDDETLEAGDRFLQVLVFVAGLEHGIGQLLDALVGQDQTLRDLLQAFEHGAKRVSHAGDYMTRRSVQVAGCR